VLVTKTLKNPLDTEAVCRARELRAQHPEVVLESLSDPQARLYYRMYVATRVGDKHLCVVVKITDNDAFILTAYLVTKPAGGRKLWPKDD